MRFLVIFASIVFFSCQSPERNEVNLVPHPQKLDLKDGFFEWSNQSQWIVDSIFIAEYYYLKKIAQVEPLGQKNTIHFAHKEGLQKEEYFLYVSPDSLRIEATYAEGLMRGIQTLRQLSNLQGRIKIPSLEIHDFPAFSWRGLLLDCCRHFMDKEFVMRYIDLLAYHKMNVLHWHLTEDQAWRLAIDQYPKLTSVGAWRKGENGKPYGGFYTKEDVREILAYAKERHIEVVPEIEMPGHAQAALAAYPNLSCTGGPFEVQTDWGVFKDIYCVGNDSVFEFIENVLDEVMELFPSEYIHIGGDEAPKFRWDNCAKCQKRLIDEGLVDSHELQSYFIKRVERYLNKNGRQLIGWDEILEGGLAPSATVQSWRGMDGGVEAVKSGRKAIMSPTSHCYFDYDLDAIDLEKVYSFNPIPDGLPKDQEELILGGEGNMWSERAPQETVDSKVFPRVLALSEVLWKSGQKDYSSFYDRVQKHYAKLDDLGVNYGYESSPIYSEVSYSNQKFIYELKSSTPNIAIEYQLNGGVWQQYEQAISIAESCLLKARGFKNGKHYGNFEQQLFNTKSTAKEVQYITNFHPSYPAKGEGTLTDGLTGSSTKFRDGHWQGYSEENMEVVVDLGQVQDIINIETSYFQYNLSWIMLPREVAYSVSDDGINFTKVYHMVNNVSPKKKGQFKHSFISNNKCRGRYVKVSAINFGILPDWHPAAGAPSWLFVDEVMIL
jgi:hexosaminidase